MSRNKRATDEYTSFFARPLCGLKLAAVKCTAKLESFFFLVSLTTNSSIVIAIGVFNAVSYRLLPFAEMVNAFRQMEIRVKTKLVPRPITKTRVERREVKNCLQSKWRVFVTIVGEKLPQNNQFFRNFCL